MYIEDKDQASSADTIESPKIVDSNSSNDDDEKTFKLEIKSSHAVQPEPIKASEERKIPKIKTLYDNLYKEKSNVKKRTISAVFLGIYLAVIFVFALFSDNLMLVAASNPYALGIAPFVISIFLIGGSTWTIWYIAKEITNSYMVVKNINVQRQVFGIMLTSILIVTLSYFWAPYFWAKPNLAPFEPINNSAQNAILIMFVSITSIMFAATFALGFVAFYRNGQTAKKSILGALLTLMVSFFYIFFYYCICARNWSIIALITSIAFLSDIFAYFGGNRFGKHKLAPSISPNKTWEGFLIGFFVATLAGVGLIAMYSIPVWTKSISCGNSHVSNFAIQYQIWGWQIGGTGPFVGQATAASTANNAWGVAGAMIPAILALTSTLGDLLFSKLKRYVQIKDFSEFLPGHGGILDRFDSVIFSTIVFVGLSILMCLCTQGLNSSSPLLSNLGILTF